MARSASESGSGYRSLPPRISIELAMGACVEALRLSRSLDVETLADMTGIPAALLLDYEAGTKRASAHDVVQLATELGVPVSALFATVVVV